MTQECMSREEKMKELRHNHITQTSHAVIVGTVTNSTQYVLPTFDSNIGLIHLHRNEFSAIQANCAAWSNEPNLVHESSPFW